MHRPTVLVIAEEREFREHLAGSLLRSGLVELANDRGPDLVCLGCVQRVSTRDLEAARRVEGNRKAPILLLTSHGSEELAVQAFRFGVSDYLRMPFTRSELESVLASLFPSVKDAGPIRSESIVGQGAAMREIKSYIEKVARTNSNVLITGETGTGKELIAELIHKNSPRACFPLVCINCAAIPDSLLESELFGYERGAFTGAHAAQDGKLKLADGGTLFLDEIGDMSPYAQAKVLRAIESREIQRLGGHRTQPVDFRLIAATNRDLESLAAEGGFRRDLFFRLNVAHIHLPPLRERKEDILALGHFFRLENNRKFGRETTGFTAATEDALLAHAWPGNVRELKNIIEAAFINLDPGATRVALPGVFCRALERKDKLGETELERMLAVLSETSWNKSQAAEKLHWSRMTLYRKMSHYQISGPASFRSKAS